jgi:hypothetical protein
VATITATESTEDLLYFSFPISKPQANKWEKDDKGHIVVKGVATDGSVDSDEQIVDADWSAKALSEWLQTGGNVRMAHDQFKPVGKGLQVELNRDGDGKHWVKSLIVNNDAKTLVEEGVLTAYSVGISRPVIKRDPTGKARGGIICGGQICELSIVDRPANKSCYLEIAKSDSLGKAEYVGELHQLNKTADAEIKKYSPADLAAFLQQRATAEKRDMDPDVGGGTDRDKIPAADFAGRNRSFPIVTPGDVSDAASSIGRAGSDNYSSDKLKENIIRIARRKGPSFVAELPDSWTNEGSKKMAQDTDTDTQDDASTTQDDQTSQQVDGEGAGAPMKADTAKGKKPFPGAAPPLDGKDSDGDGKDTDKPGSEEDDDEKEPAKVKPGSSKAEDALVEKGSKDCPNCGKNYHADSKLKRCESCNAKLPRAEKAAKPMCPGCNAKMSKGGKFCPGCGKPASAEKAAKPTPADGAVAANAIRPVPAHREPDGPDIEALEHDMHIPTDPDGKYIDAQMKTITRFKSVGVPTDLGVLHDMTCAAYHPESVKSAHPDADFHSMDVTPWQSKALDAATGAPLDEALKAQALWQHAVTLKGTDPELLTELRYEAHKSFADANPGPGKFPQPTELHAQSFRRPYLSGGHAAPSPGQDAPNSASVPTNSLTANQFNRPFLQDGGAADSPSNKGEAPQPAPVPTGEPSRVYYRNGQRDNAKAAMQAMHDHIAQTFPDLCPMNGEPGGAQTTAAANQPVPTPGHMKAETPTETTETLLKGSQPDVIKSMMHQVTAPLMDELRAVREELKKERKRTEQLQKSVDALGSEADPNVNAFRGVAQFTRPQAAPAEPVLSRDQLAVRAMAEQINYFEDLARKSADPAQREAMWTAVDRLKKQAYGLTAK